MTASAEDSTRVVSSPAVLWRVGYKPDPLAARDFGSVDLGTSTAGNRFDSATGAYHTGYYGTSLEACFGECLSPLRPDPGLSALMAEDWDDLGDAPGEIGEEWREKRVIVKASVDTYKLAFLNLECFEVVTELDRVLGGVLPVLGLEGHLDVAKLRGPERRLTRVVSQYAWAMASAGDHKPTFAGLRYMSKHCTESSWECWATFEERVTANVLEVNEIEPDMPELVYVAKQFGLKIA